MLAGLGIAGDTDPDAHVRRATSTTWSPRSSTTSTCASTPTRRAPRPRFDRAERAAARPRRRSATRRPRLRACAATPRRGRRRRARRSRAPCAREVERRKRRRRPVHLRRHAHPAARRAGRPAPGAAACARLRARYSVVLVDEFQDTDPVQWDDPARRVPRAQRPWSLIGDPKQAIYAFRGADVVSYLEAAEPAGHAATLATNWRSDARCSRALDTVFGGAALGDDADRRPAGRRPPTRTAGWSGRRSTRRSGCASLPRDGPAAHWQNGLPIVAGARDGSPPTSPPTSPRCSPPARAGGRARPDARARRHRRAGAHQRPGHPGARGPRRGRRPGRARRRRQRVRHRRRRGLADAAARRSSSRTAPSGSARRALTCFLGRTRRRARRRRRRASLDELGGDLRRWAARAARPRRRRAARGASPPTPGCAARLLGQRDGERRLTDLRHIGAGAARRGRRRRTSASAALSSGCARRSPRPRAGTSSARAQPAAGVRRRRRPDHHRAPQQGPGVPGGVRAVRLGPVRPARARACRCLPRRRRARGCSTSAARPDPGWRDHVRPRQRPRRPARTCGCSTSR